jgi:hypothetical protein
MLVVLGMVVTSYRIERTGGIFDREIIEALTELKAGK